jgi:hypothetical protein
VKELWLYRLGKLAVVEFGESWAKEDNEEGKNK